MPPSEQLTELQRDVLVHVSRRGPVDKSTLAAALGRNRVQVSRAVHLLAGRLLVETDEDGLRWTATPQGHGLVQVSGWTLDSDEPDVVVAGDATGEPERWHVLPHNGRMLYGDGKGGSTLVGVACAWRHGPERDRVLAEAEDLMVTGLAARERLTREQVVEAISDAITEHVWAHGSGEISGDGIGEAADAVVALLDQLPEGTGA